MAQPKIRNFCIIAHIDHGKSTLADRFLEITKTVDQRRMKSQLLDQMDLERERGITIKLQPVRMDYELAGEKYVLNLIDTPGHVDFSYEVSRSLAAVEGAILLVDATQGIQAQTLGNLYLALEQDLKIIPVINKIDLPNAEVERVIKDLANLLGCTQEEIILASAKTGQGVREILQAVVKQVPEPTGPEDGSLRALVFDSLFDEYKGVVAYLRIDSGRLQNHDKIYLMATQTRAEILELGVFKPQFKPTQDLKAGEIGYAATGLKTVDRCRVGDTVTLDKGHEKVRPLRGYKEIKPMVFAGIFPKEGHDYSKLREAMSKLKLSDSSLVFEPEHSVVLGFGFRAGFLGLLHLEIVQERLVREYDLDLILTTPSVAYKVFKTDQDSFIIKGPDELPDPSQIQHVEEPIMQVDIMTPKQYLGSIMELAQKRRGVLLNTEFLDEERAFIHYRLPLNSILVDFYDKIKSVSSGFATFNYEFAAYKTAEVVKLDILVANEPVEALASIVYKDSAFQIGKKIVQSLKNVLPRQMFEIKIQAAIGGKIIAAERLSAMRKDVTAKLYGGDVTRKRKLLEKQKKGKKKMKALGKVEIPREAFLAVLRR